MEIHCHRQKTVWWILMVSGERGGSLFIRHCTLETAVLQCKHLQVNRGYSTGDIAQAVVSISQGCGDCWGLLLIGALNTRSGDRWVLRPLSKIQEGKASVLGHQPL